MLFKQGMNITIYKLFFFYSFSENYLKIFENFFFKI